MTKSEQNHDNVPGTLNQMLAEDDPFLLSATGPGATVATVRNQTTQAKEKRRKGTFYSSVLEDDEDRYAPAPLSSGNIRNTTMQR